MKILRRQRLVALLLGLALAATACGDDDDSSSGDDESVSIIVGSADFAESQIVASMYALALENAGVDVSEKTAIGAREAYFPALEEGEIDLVPEFIASAVLYLEGEASTDTDEGLTALEESLPEGLIALEPAPAQSVNVFVVTQETADEYDLETVSDLAAVADELTLGGPPECPERDQCLIGLADTYDADFTDNFTPLDAGGPLTKEALSDGEIDVALLFTTDADIADEGWVMLEDDKALQLAENVVPVINEDVATDEVQDVLNGVSEKLTDAEYQELMRLVIIEEEDPEDVARQWLEDNDLID